MDYKILVPHFEVLNTLKALNNRYYMYNVFFKLVCY